MSLNARTFASGMFSCPFFHVMPKKSIVSRATLTFFGLILMFPFSRRSSTSASLSR